MTETPPLNLWHRAFFKVRRGLSWLEWGTRWLSEELRSSPVRNPQEIAWPAVDMNGPDPVAAIIATAEYRQAAKWFETDLDRPMTSACSRALLYCLTRNLRPRNAFEIGTYRAGSSEAICRALERNGTGVLHTTDPFGRLRVPPILMRWPRRLRQRIKFYPWNSMAFLMHMQDMKLTTPLAFVDGHHDYPFALFDLQLVATLTEPAGFVVMDNMDLAGVVQAVDRFLSDNPGWRVCGESAPGSRCVAETVFCILQRSGIRDQVSGDQIVA